jgi:putative DNA primase/helicase
MTKERILEIFDRPDPPNLLPYALTDEGNAQRLIAFSNGNLCYCPERETWLVWNGRYWEAVGDGLVLAVAERTMQIFLQQASGRGKP